MTRRILHGGDVPRRVLLCSVVVGYQRFRCPCCFHFTLKLVAEWNSERLVSYHKTLWRQHPEELDLKLVHDIRGCVHKLPDWRTANGLRLYRYFVSQCSEFWRHNALRCFSTSVYCCKRVFLYRLSPETFEYTLVNYILHITYHDPRLLLQFLLYDKYLATYKGK
jgi:hypothetical protein